MMIRICYKTPQGPLSVDFATMYQAIHFLRLVDEADFISATKVFPSVEKVVEENFDELLEYATQPDALVAS